MTPAKLADGFGLKEHCPSGPLGGTGLTPGPWVLRSPEGIRRYVLCTRSRFPGVMPDRAGAVNGKKAPPAVGREPSSGFSSASRVPELWIDEIPKGAALEVPPEVLEEQLVGSLEVMRGRSRDVRRQDHVGQLPEGAPRRERLGGEHVEPCPGDRSAAERIGERDLV